MSPRYTPPVADLSRYGGSWGDRDVPYHGSPTNEVWPGRRVAHFTGRSWLNNPEQCTAAHGDTTWVADDQLLICNGCGLDCTIRPNGPHGEGTKPWGPR
jgi:hypothetical protein